MVAWKRGCQVGLVAFYEVGVGLESVAQCVEERCLKSAEAVVESRYVRLCEREALVVAFGCESVDMRAAGVGQSHYLGAFVEGFTCGVVDSTA